MDCSKCKYFQYEIRRPNDTNLGRSLFYYCDHKAQPLVGTIRDVPCNLYKKKKRGTTKVVFNYKDIFYTGDDIRIYFSDDSSILLENYRLNHDSINSISSTVFYGSISKIERIRKEN